MPNLAQSLHAQDLGHLRIIAEHWGIELTAPDAKTALPILTTAILNQELVVEICEALKPEAQAALSALLENNGRLSWARFERRFGEVRAVGPGRRDRERPDRMPISAAEVLWYRAFVARSFFETSVGAQEFAYLPDDLLPLVALVYQESGLFPKIEKLPVLGRAAVPSERVQPIFVNDRLLDHVCTLLASHRLGIDPGDHLPVSEVFLPFATTLLRTAGLLGPDGLPDTEAARNHLEMERGAALAQLFQTWQESQDHNDLHLVPHLQPEGEWRNDPFGARQFVISLLAQLPVHTWWSLSAFLADLRRDFPDFQRPASDYDSWFIRDTRSGEFLQGFEKWDQVDGAFVRYLITGPLHWLGILELATPEDGLDVDEATAFRLSKWATELLKGATPSKFLGEDGVVHVRSDGRVDVPFSTPRLARYQIARFCQWTTPTSHEYRYRMTPVSLEIALDQGLQIKHFQVLLSRYAKNIPPNIMNALQRWDQRGTEARVQNVMILRLGSPELLQKLRASRAARFLGDPLGPTTVVIKPGAAPKVLEILAEMGYLGEFIDAE